MRSTCALVLLAVLAGCAIPGTSAPAAPAATSAPAFPPGDEIPQEIQVRTPKDARGLPVCAMITPDQLTALGLRPETARGADPPVAAPYSDCTWTLTADPDDAAGIAVRTDTAHPALLGVYRVRSALSMFEPTQVSGHPAVAERGHPTGPCSIDVGIADDQLLSATGSTRRHAPCDLSRRLAEAVLANLPLRR